MHAAKRQIRRLPNLHSRGVGGKGWAADVIGADEIDSVRRAIDHRHRDAFQPYIFAQQGGGIGGCVEVIFSKAITPNALVMTLQRSARLISIEGLVSPVGTAGAWGIVV